MSHATHILTGWTFDQSLHLCRDASGIVIPSVTQVLKAAGHSVDLARFQPKELLDRKSAIGTEVHWLTDVYDEHGGVDANWLNESNTGFYRSWVELKKMGGFKVIATSVRLAVCINGWRFTGEIDKEVIFSNGQHGIIDLKCSEARPKSWEYQTGAYELMKTGRTHLDPRRVRAVARLYEDGRPGKLIEHTDLNDGHVFLSALHTVTTRLKDKTLRDADL